MKRYTILKFLFRFIRVEKNIFIFLFFYFFIFLSLCLFFFNSFGVGKGWSIAETFKSEKFEKKIGILKGPYLQNVKKYAITVMWETNLSANSRVEYGVTQKLGQSIEDSSLKTIHELTIPNLSEETKYYYRVASQDTFSQIASFNTAPHRDTPFRLAVWGDNRTNFIEHTEMANGIKKAKPDIAISVGDVVTNGEQYDQWGREYFLPIKKLAMYVPTFIAIGNHENNAHWFYDFVSQPGNESFFSFDYGNTHFIIIDSNKPYVSGSEQYRWLIRDLESESFKNAEWHLVFMHHPLYSEGWDKPGYDGEPLARTFLQPLFEKFKIDIVFAGHTHDYERGYLKGVYYIITGGGGSFLDKFIKDFEHITVYKSAYHFCTVDINGKKLIFSAKYKGGEVFDTFTIKVKE